MATDAETHTGGPKTILVVDDDPGCSNQLAELLRCQGFSAVGVTSGPAALLYVDENGPPGLILLDLIMPEMNGIEVLSKIHERYPDVPVCLITALYDEHLLRAAFRMGAYDCVTKPMDFEYLRSAVISKVSPTPM